MREPGFWHRPSSWQARLLALPAAVYGRIALRRFMRAGQRVAVPVICVGNYHVGGAGKTPTVLALAALLRRMGEHPVVVSRGYGGKLTGPAVVEPLQHAAAEVGDEPLMMASEVPVIVARDRAAGAAMAVARGASVILLDDGFQNPALVKSASVIVIDARRGIGNGQVFPAGPLRAPLEPQLARTDALVVVGEGHAADTIAGKVAARGKPVWRAELVPQPNSLAVPRSRRCLAFAGIGDPDRFFATLRGHGVDVVREAAFADHHPYRRDEIEALAERARGEALALVTTQKDFVRIASDPALADLAPSLTAFRVKLSLNGDVEGFLQRVLRRD